MRGPSLISSETIEQIRAYVDERDWSQFHTPANLAKSVSIEAGELLENFQWNDEIYDVEALGDEIADVLIYALMLADACGLDPDMIIQSKIVKTREKYPIEASRGRSTKYDQL